MRPQIVYEHPDFYVVSKPPMWLTHPVRARYTSPDVVSFMGQHTGETYLSPPHRLDRETSGAQVLSRDKDAARVFFTLFKERLVGKTYLALVHGWPTWEEYTLDAPLGKLGLGAGNQVQMRQGVIPDGKSATTHFRVLGRRQHAQGPVSLVQAQPTTGRLHQIRAHLYHLGLPMVGDKMYGRDPSAFLEFAEHGPSAALTARLLLPRQALHAESIAFPYAGAQVRVAVPLSEDLQSFWDALEEPLGQKSCAILSHEP